MDVLGSIDGEKRENELIKKAKIIMGSVRRIDVPSGIGRGEGGARVMREVERVVV